MPAIPVIAVFDIGKTNKKLLLFDQNYNIVYEQSASFVETVDEDGDPCENLESLRSLVFNSMRQLFENNGFDLKAVNFSTYGASLVYINGVGEPLTALYNYLKVYPEALKNKFYKKYGGEEAFSLATASPVLGSLNSGMQLYRIKHEHPALFKQIKYALHLPQYLAYLLTGNAFSDITSIGCHTNLWDFRKSKYHQWVNKEGLGGFLAPIVPHDKVLTGTFAMQKFLVGPGLHDSSAALIPYLVNFQEPFSLISSGTWCISLNSFNNTPLTEEELKQDCLCYLNYKGTPVKASRLFAGREHEEGVKRIAAHFNQSPLKFSLVTYSADVISVLKKRNVADIKWSAKDLLKKSLFSVRDLSFFSSDTEAYHQLMMDITEQQVASAKLVLKGTGVKRIFVDGGFSRNNIYMNLLALAFPGFEVFAASMTQATALGAALAIHEKWNKKELPGNLINLHHYPVAAQS